VSEKITPPHISRTFYGRASYSSYPLIIFCGVLASVFMLFFPIGGLIVTGEPAFELYPFLISLVLWHAFFKHLLSGERLDYRDKSFERKIGVVTDVKESSMFSKYCYIFLDNEDVQYRVAEDAAYIEGRVGAKRRTTNDWIHFRKGSKVELFYGQRSKSVVWANILYDLENMSIEDMTKEAVEELTIEELEAAFLEGLTDEKINQMTAQEIDAAFLNELKRRGIDKG